MSGYPVSMLESIKRLEQTRPFRLTQEIPRLNFAEREQLYRIHELAAKWFAAQLNETENRQHALAYLKQRNLTDETIKIFKLGFAPAGDNLSQFLLAKGYSKDLLVKSGISINAGAKIYDRFKNRIIFPIEDYRGRIIAFGGRVLDDSQPKYLNSPETPIFSKSQNLYGLSQAAANIRKQNVAVLVEGYMDVIACHQHGVTNAVASLGTALTVEQGKLLLRYAEKLFFAYDSDAAGKKAVQKGIATLSDLGFHIKVVSYPDAKDPDEYLSKHGVEKFQELLQSAQSSFTFLLEYAMSGKDIKNPTEKSEVLKDLFPFVAKIKDLVVKEEYLKQAAFTLGINESTVFNEFRKFLKKIPANVNFSANFGKNTLVNSEKQNIRLPDKYRGKILATAIQNSKERQKIASLIDFPFSDNIPEQKLYNEVVSSETDNIEGLIKSLSEDLQGLARKIIFSDKYLLEGKETIEDIVLFLSKQYIKKRIEEINGQLAQYNISAGLTPEFKALLSEKQRLQAKLK